MDDKNIIKVIKKVMPAIVSIAIAKHLEDLEREMPREFSPRSRATPQKNRQNRRSRFDGGQPRHGGGGRRIRLYRGSGRTRPHEQARRWRPECRIHRHPERRPKFPAEILSRDPINDVAILKIPASGLPSLTLGDATKLELGQSVIAIGNALGIFKNTVSLGIVSGLSRS